jgi:hypothetical protein
VVAPVFEDVPLLPEPDWDLLNKRCGAGYPPAQGRACKCSACCPECPPKQAQSGFHTKENKKKSDHTILFAEGLGRHLTHDSTSLGPEREEREAEELEQRQVAWMDWKAVLEEE